MPRSAKLPSRAPAVILRSIHGIIGCLQPRLDPSGSILWPPQDLVPVFLAASFHGRRLPALEATGSGCPHRAHAGSTAAAPPWLALELSHAAVQAAAPPPAGSGQELYETESPRAPGHPVCLLAMDVGLSVFPIVPKAFGV